MPVTGHFCPVSRRYEVRVEACTELGCASSDWAAARTAESAPLLQPPPHLEVRSAPGGLRPAVSVLWAGPQQPNGRVSRYELYRRQAAARPVLTYNGSASSFLDSELAPFTEYEYQVRSARGEKPLRRAAGAS